MGLMIGLGSASAGSSGGGGGGERLIDAGFVVTAKIKDNGISELPAIDTSGISSAYEMFCACTSLTEIPQMDTSRVEQMAKMFYSCTKITTIPQLDMPCVQKASYMFYNCQSLMSTPEIDAPEMLTANSMFVGCVNLQYVPMLKTPKVTDYSDVFSNCVSLRKISYMDVRSCSTSLYTAFNNDSKLVDAYLFGLKANIGFHYCGKLSKESVLYLFENAQTVTSTCTITLHADVFAQLTDEEIAIATEKGFSVVSA